MRKQDAITLLGVTEKTFQMLVSEKSIRRTHLRNGHYSYNEDDIRKLANIQVKQKEADFIINKFEDMAQIIPEIIEALKINSKITIKTSADNLLYNLTKI